jgi:hypothetical protein
MKFTLNDGPVELNQKPPCVVRAEQWLRQQPDGSLVTLRHVAAAAGVTHYTMHNVGQWFNPALRVNFKNKYLYGNEKTISAFRKEHQL